MRSKILKRIFFITIFLFLNNKVNAAYIYVDPMYDESNMQIYLNIDDGYYEHNIIRIKEKNKEYNGYCLDALLPINGDQNIYKYAENTTEYLNEYFKNQEKSTELEKKINRYIYFGYEYNNQKSYKYLLATQKLIWDELHDAKYYSSSYKKRPQFYALNENTEDGNLINITNEINKIKNNISNYEKTPSFCNTTINDLIIGKNTAIKDNENVLSQYTVICDDNLNCKINDNQLEITTNSKITGSSTITLLKEGSKTQNNIYKNEDEQGVIINNGAIDSISCQFTINIKEYNPEPTSQPNPEPKPSSSSSQKPNSS